LAIRNNRVRHNRTAGKFDSLDNGVVNVLGQALADLGDRIADIVPRAIAISNKKLTVVLE